ncbi:MAG: hypothetical protein LUD27_04905 [Clostridia bacterium]|nr:hypothetical protein [Clostridia bacterium]
MKKSIIRVGACCVVLAMAGSLASACDTSTKDEAVSYVSVDVNPSISLSLDKNDKVLSVYAANEDAQVLLYEEDLTGLSVEDALAKIADLSVEMNYINDGNYGVDILVEGEADADEIIASATASFTASAEEEGIDVNISSEGTFTLQRELDKINAEYNLDLSVAELSLILEAQSVDNTLTISAAAEMDTEELIAIINTAASQLEPYATAAYNSAVRVAQSAYYNAKNSALASVWCIPYTADLVHILTGNRQYEVNYGLLYTMYTGAYGVLDTALLAVEEVESLAEQTAVPASVLAAVAEALGVESLEGVSTFAELNDYLDSYIKNMTAEERAAAEETIQALMAEVQAFADTIDESVSQEYKEAFSELCENLTSCIPEYASVVASEYVSEFNSLVTELSAALDGKEPEAAAYAALETIGARADETLETMKTDLSETDLATVNSMLETINSTLSGLENALNSAITNAENEAKEYLSSLKEGRIA